MTDRPTVLVTGVGAVIGYGIVNALRMSARPVRVVGMDIYADAYGRFIVDEFVQATRAADPGYVEFVRRLVAEQAVDLIIPGIEQDLYALADHRERIPTRIVLNNDLCLRLARSKLETFRHFAALGETFVIPTLEGSAAVSYESCVAALGSPFILKPVSSYASKGLALIHSLAEFQFHSARAGPGGCVYQRFVGTDDQEYTVAAFGDGAGGYFDSITLRRTLSLEGATKTATFVPEDEAITACLDSICRSLRPVGPTNIQLRKEGDSVYLLEINPRISSACSIRARMGYNEPEMCVRHFLQGERIEPGPRRPGSVVRFIEDHFIEP